MGYNLANFVIFLFSLVLYLGIFRVWGRKISPRTVLLVAVLTAPFNIGGLTVTVIGSPATEGDSIALTPLFQSARGKAYNLVSLIQEGDQRAFSLANITQKSLGNAWAGILLAQRGLTAHSIFNMFQVSVNKSEAWVSLAQYSSAGHAWSIMSLYQRGTKQAESFF